MLDARLKLRHLQALVSLSERRSVLASAQALSRTPSAVSKSLTELEAIVGTRLFERTRRGLVATPAGERLLQEVRRGLGLLDGALEVAAGRPAAGSAVRVTLGVLPTTASTLAPAAVQQFQQLHPGVLVHVVAGTNIDLLERLRQRQLDMVIGRLSEAAQMFDLSFAPLYEEPLALVAAPGHPLAALRGLAISQLRPYPFIVPDAHTIVRSSLDAVLIAGGMPRPPRLIETLSADFARELVTRHEAVWFCAPGAVQRDLEDGRLVQLDVDLTSTRRAVGLSVRADMPQAPEAAALADLLRDQARRLRAGARAAGAKILNRG